MRPRKRSPQTLLAPKVSGPLCPAASASGSVARADLHAVHEQAQRRAVIGGGQVGPLVRIEVAWCRAGPGSGAEVHARHVGVAAGVERVGHAARRLLEDHGAPVGGRLRPHPGLEGQRAGHVDRRRRPARWRCRPRRRTTSARPKRPAFAACRAAHVAVVARRSRRRSPCRRPPRSRRPRPRARRRCRRSGCRGRTALVPPFPSSAVTSTATASPESPLPGSARSSVRPVAPLIAVPLRNHWYW